MPVSRVLMCVRGANGYRSGMTHRLTLFFCGWMACAAAHGGDVYRWVDGNGQVHYGDSVPDSQKRKATPIDTSSAAPTDSQRRDAEARVAREKAIADTLM